MGYIPRPLCKPQKIVSKRAKKLFLEQKGLRMDQKGSKWTKKVLKCSQNILSINSFGLGSTIPPCFEDKIFFWKEGFSPPYSKNKCSSKAFGDQRFPMWSILVTKSLQAPMFRWPKVWRVVQVPRCPNPSPHVRPLGRLRQRHSGLNVTMVLYGIA